MSKVNNAFLWLFVIAALVGCGYILTRGNLAPPLGGVTVGNEYTVTSTPARSGGWQDQRLKGSGAGNTATAGALGSVIITKAGDLEFKLLDATTSLALSDVATSTVLLAEFPASLAAGTYMFDVGFNTGLFLDVMSGNVGSSTITFR